MLTDEAPLTYGTSFGSGIASALLLPTSLRTYQPIKQDK